MRSLAVWVLCIVAARHYGWQFFDPELRGIVSKALGAAAALCFLLMIYASAPSRALGVAVSFGVFEELQTVICSVSYAVAPWPVQTGQAICSARLDFDIDALGVMVLAFVLHAVASPVRSDTTKADSEARK